MRQQRCPLPLAALFCLAAVTLAACGYRGDIDLPPTIKLTWYSYINGDDLRDACEPGAATRYRLVYNADYQKQLRSYEVEATAAGAARLTTRVQGPGAFDFGRWATSEKSLSADRFAALEKALSESGAFAAPPLGLRVYSDQYYWVLTACREGRFSFNVWAYPSPRYDALDFPDLLFAEDESGIAVAPPRDVGPAARMKGSKRGEKENPIFELRVGEAGFRGHLRI